jgi:cephalosporin-C deacetylase-like acetyl esterase
LTVALFDLPLEKLEGYRPDRLEPADFDTFWHDTLETARKRRSPARFEAVDVGLQIQDVPIEVVRLSKELGLGRHETVRAHR